MNGIVRPKGRAPVGIYWRRRLVLFAVVLLAAAGVMKLVGGGDEPDASASSASTAQDKGSPDSDDDGGSGADDRNRKRTSRADGADPDVRSGTDNVRVRMGSAEPCDPGRVTVTPSLPPDTYAGDEIALRLGFATDGADPCVLSLSDHTPLISVSADGKTVWSSQKCSDLFDTGRLRVEPDWTTYVDAHWSGRVSGSSCGDNADFAEPGDYTVQAALLGGEPAKATVSLEKEPKKEEPKQDKGDDEADEDGKGDQDDGDAKQDGNDSGDQGGRNDDGRGRGEDSDSGGSDRSGVDERDGGQRDR